MDVNRVNYTPPAPAAPVNAPTVPPPVAPASAPAPLDVPTASAFAVSTEAADIYGPDRTGVRLERAVTELNRSLAPHHRHMSIGTHEATGRTMVTVYDTVTTEVIREVPPERVLDAHASLLEMAGLFMDRRG